MDQAQVPRERTEGLERANLSTRASLATDTKGRDRYEDPDPLRTVYQQDRERIAGSAAFVRLGGTSAGLPLGQGELALTAAVRTASIGRALARALRLNEDLVEAIALGRHLGQPPWGEAGRVALSGIAEPEFHQGEQGLRIVEELSADGQGLNLTFETRDGILHQDGAGAATVEGRLVAALARFHLLSGDLERALGAGVAQAADVPTAVRLLGPTHAQRMATYVDDVAASSPGEPAVCGSPALVAACDELARWRVERLEGHPTVLAAVERVVHCLRSLAVHHAVRMAPGAVVDAICCLTDVGARQLFEELFLPDPQRP